MIYSEIHLIGNFLMGFVFGMLTGGAIINSIWKRKA